LTARPFQTIDVFTETALAGNPLAVVFDAEGLDDARMQAIAAEFNLSETVFVFEPRNAVNSARVRIFTPKREMPFAGHPTVGTAALIAHERAGDLLLRQDLRIVLEEPIGDVVCVARRRKGQALAAYFELPKLPERLEAKPPSAAEIASGLGLEPSDIGFDGHKASLYSAGAPFLFVPVRSLDAIGRAAPGIMPWATKDGPATFLYTRETEREGSAYHARMFAGAWGVAEDPATGSAAAAFAGVVRDFDRPRDGESMLIIEQGFEMGRPSLIALGLTIENGALASATIGGSVVIVANGSLDL
jgi:trans-2,3-dihydro-3-hydroxyanthranilate isomerase